jgi:glutamate-1-semialdehyde 2,1-aminomutase
VWDVAGREYIDYHLSSGPALLGHGHPAVTDAVATQLPKGTTFFFLNEPEIQLARRLVDAIPCAEVVHYTGSGTEATFYALRIARAWTGRNKVLKFEGAWHGMHDYGLWGTVPSRPSDYPHAAPDSVGVPRETGDTVLVTPFNEAQRAVELIERHAAELAAVMVEPLQRVLLPEPGFLQAIREVTKRHGIVLIFDEIVTGFRIAWGGAQEKYGVVPDLACYGKAISGGFPLAAIAGKADIMSVLDARSRPKAEVVWATNTLNGNPVCAAAGVAALDVLSQPGVYDQLHRVGSRLRKGMVEAGERYGFAVQAPGEDAVWGIRFTPRKPLRTWMDLTTHDKDLGWRWAIELMKRGLLVNPNEKFYISIRHTDKDVERTLEIVDEAFAALRQAM